MTLTMEVPLRVPISMFPAGGTMERIACGSTTRHPRRHRPRPSDRAASVCPRSTERMPPRTTSAAYAASCRVSPMTAMVTGPRRSTVLTPNTRGYSAPMLNQNSSCTRIGIDLKNQMYPQLTARSTGLVESLPTASSVPSAKPSTMTAAVSQSVSPRPRSTAAVVKYSPTTSHWNASLRATEWAASASSARTRARRSTGPRGAGARCGA